MTSSKINVDPAGIADDPASVIDAAVAEQAARATPEAKDDRDRMFQRGDEVELGERIHARLTKARPWTHTQGRFWSYDNDSGVWSPEEHESVRLIVQDYAGAPVFSKKGKDGEVETKAMRMSSAMVEGSTKCLATILHDSAFFENAPTGLAFKNGFVRFKSDGTEIIDTHSPEHRARSAMPFAYRESGCPTWRSYLRLVFEQDGDAVEKIECIRQFIGLCLIGAITKQEKALILFGGGSNGKSIVLAGILACFEGQRVSIAPHKWADDYHVADLDGAWVNVVSELPSREIIDSDHIKAVISGEQVRARPIREAPFDFCPRAGHIFAVNPPLPIVSDFSDGFWRRWTMISFNRKWETDARFKDEVIEKIKKEVPGIVHWALQGAAIALKRGKMTEPASSVAALQRWRRDADVVATFIDEELVAPAPDGEQRSLGAIYTAYTKWCARAGHRRPLSQVRFRGRCEALGLTPTTSEGGAVWFNACSRESLHS